MNIFCRLLRHDLQRVMGHCAGALVKGQSGGWGCQMRAQGGSGHQEQNEPER
jgi:hypothetical protein